MKKIVSSLSLIFLGTTVYYAQIGIQTNNPQATFHIDGAKDNPETGTISAAQQANDVVVTSTGAMGIGTAAPDASSSLEVNTTTKGFLPPRMNNTQRDAISLPATGLIIYSTTSNCLQTNIGTPASPNWGCIAVQGGAAVVQVNSLTVNSDQVGSEVCLGSLCIRHNGAASEGSIQVRSNTGGDIPYSSVAGFQVATSGVNEGNTWVGTLTTAFQTFYRGGASIGEFINYQICTGTGEHYRVFLTLINAATQAERRYLLNMERVR
jgi:hypothetical protein